MSMNGEAIHHPFGGESRDKAVRGFGYYKTLGKCVLFGKGWEELGHTLEEASKPARLKGGYVCLPVDPEHEDVVAIHAAPFNPRRRVDHLWDGGADVFLLNREDARSSSQVHIETASETIEFRELSERSMANLAHFIRQHKEQAVMSEELLESVAIREQALYERLHVDIEPIVK